MQLYDHPGNPIPSGAVVESVRTPDGVDLRAAYWPSLAAVNRGTVVIAQGRSEFIEKYFETIRDLQTRGFMVAALDWRGQGGSSRLLANPRLGHVDDFSDYEVDLRTFLEEFALKHCRPPFFALGHSTGGAVLLRAASWLDGTIERMVLSAPLVDFYGLSMPRRMVRTISGGFSYFGLGGSAIPNAKDYELGESELDEFERTNKLTSDPVRFTRVLNHLVAEPQLIITAPTYGWVYAACRTIDMFAKPDFPPTVKVPALVVLAGRDRIVDTRAAEELAICLRAGGPITVLGARHELLMEQDLYRNQFWAAFDAFIPGSDAEAAYEAEAKSASAAS
ncbi:MAG: alpha/beta hydrolase [Hyphomicrobiales bacterium]|nr:MAG: alpha/beta hydrolase [Hyphomicrobiales bacterium]